MIFRRGTKAPGKTPILLEDIRTYSVKDKKRKNQVLELRPRYLTIQVDIKKFLTLFSRKRWFVGYAGVALMIFLVSLISSSTNASIATFYPASCLGGWKNPENAVGAPALSDDANVEDFNAGNSAYMRGNADIFCGSFQGEVPADAAPKSFVLSFNISVDDGSVEHKKRNAVDPEEIINATDAEIQEILDVNASEPDGGPDQETDDISDEQETEEKETVIDDTPTEPEESNTEPVDAADEAKQTDEPTVEIDTAVGSDENTAQISKQGNMFARLFGNIARAEDSVDTAPVESEYQSTSADVVVEEVIAEETVQQTDTEIPESPTENLEETINEESPVDSVSNSSSQTENEIKEEIEESQKENEEVDAVPSDALLRVMYTLDGESWESLGYITLGSWKSNTFAIPLTVWDDLSAVQVKLEPVLSYDDPHVIYLESVVINVEYEETEQGVLYQPDFATDVLLSDTTVDDIRVIKIVRDDVPMIWYTRLIPVVEVPLDSVPTVETAQEIETSSNTQDDILPVETPVDTEVPELVPVLENIQEPIILQEISPVEPISEEPLTLREKIINIFIRNAYAEEEGGDTSGGGDSSDTGSSDSVGDESGDSSTSDSTADGEAESSTDSSAENTSSSESDTSTTEVVETVLENENTEPENASVIEGEQAVDEDIDSVFDDIHIPVHAPIVIPGEAEQIVDDATVTTIEEIVPGVIPITLTPDQIAEERAKRIEWNFVASGELVDISSPVDISGGKIFWFTSGKTALNEYNTASGSISSQTVDPMKEKDIIYLEPNGDQSEITIDPTELLITTPIEEETGVQNRTIPIFEDDIVSSQESNDLILDETIVE